MKSLYDILEDPNNRLNPFYNGFMLIIIFMSLLSLLFKNEYKVLTYIDYITVSIFIIDYILRLVTANIKLKKGLASYLIYPFTGWAIIDLLSILPSFNIISSSFKIFRVLRLSKLFRGIRILKIFKISKQVKIFVAVFKKGWLEILTATFWAFVRLNAIEIVKSLMKNLFFVWLFAFSA